ncbi:NTP transferase domain-containing protein [bacterium]|nr:NTP transferase domain-containing protein [bacterium]
MRRGAVILCGGHSRRMGQPKALLPFGDELMLQRVCRILGEIVPQLFVVAAQHQELPELSPTVTIVRDEYDSLGPLAGIATGLGAARATCDSVFVTACDVPLLKPAFVERMFGLLADHDAAIPTDGEHVHVLSGIYRPELEDVARKLLNRDQRRPLFLVRASSSLLVPETDLRDVDPALHSLQNTNTPDEYQAALQLAEFR